jgi:peptidoglycan/xylan/chitin deacetylase (PgdA/CDA1 family)
MKSLLFRRNPAEVLGIILLAVAVLIYFINPLLSAALAFFYIILCVVASFFPQTNLFLPVINRGKTGKKFVALTFDDGPSEPVTKHILDLLDKYSVKATFFVSGINALYYPEIVQDIIARGHSIGNHSYSHNPFLMLKSYRTLYREIAEAQRVLREMGIEALIFRPPIGIVNPKLAVVLDKLGMFCVTFSCRAFDAGNLRVKNISKKILKKVKSDDIILLHDVPARSPQVNGALLAQVETILEEIVRRGFTFVELNVLINKEIMRLRNNI